jgi:predicted methyltransferase
MFRMPPREADEGGGSRSADPVRSISARMNLKEGEEAVRRVLREVHRRGKVGTKDLARATRLPIPVVAAIRRELEKGGIIARRGGAVLTEEGERYVREELGMAEGGGPAIEVSEGEMLIPDEHSETLEKLREYSALRPEPSPQLDQAFATPETALRRALYMLERGDLEGRDALFLGDDDFTSVAAGLLGVAKGITVIDIDERLIKVIEDVLRDDGLEIECVVHDLRKPLPEGLRGRFDVVLTDPPYTVPGLELFLSRGVDALRGRKTASVYLCFADKPPLEMLEVHRAITSMGLFVRELIPRFNLYEGAEMFGNTTFMARLATTEETRPAVTGVFKGKIYTGDVRPTRRIYRCRCGERIRVGVGGAFETIEALKSSGCPRCGRKEGFRLRRRVRLKEDPEVR